MGFGVHTRPFTDVEGYNISVREMVLGFGF